MYKRQAIVFTFSIFALSVTSDAETFPILDLTPGMDQIEIGPYLRYKLGYEGAIDHNSLMDQVGAFQALETENIHFGVPNGKILILFQVRNLSNTTGNWILSTNRGTLKYFKFYELSPDNSKLLIDGDDKAQVKHNLQSYQSFSHEVVLSSGETKIYAIHFEPENLAYLPLELRSYSSFFQARRANISMVSAVVSGVLILIFVNVVFFSVTGKQEFFWLGLAELAYALNTLHTEGYMTIFWLYDKPLLSLAISDILKCGFVAAMSQVARSFINTRHNFPKTDKILLALIGVSFTVCILSAGVQYYSVNIKFILHAISWLLVLIIGFYLPFVAIITVRQLGIEYWPLIPAWGSLCCVILYAIVATIGVFPSLPFYWHIIGPLGLFEAAMMTLALGLHVRKIHHEKMQADENLTKSLIDNLSITEKARTLAGHKAAALATIHDQNLLIHAAGHDSRQVVFAINSAISHLDLTKSDNHELSNMLKASADYLNDIISVTMSGANSADVGSHFICLGPLNTGALLKALEYIYAPLFQKKGLFFETKNYVPAALISDSAVLMRILSNILSNSLKFTEHGGVELSAQMTRDEYVIKIKDTGCGISKPILTALNSNDYSRKKENELLDGEGSGLKFSIEMIKHLGGDLKIQSNKDEYTSVMISLPYMDISHPITIEELKALQSGVDFRDVDNETLSSLPNAARQKIAVTHDNSSTNRGRLSELFDLMILKPVHKEVVDHPVMKSLLQDL